MNTMIFPMLALTIGSMIISFLLNFFLSKKTWIVPVSILAPTLLFVLYFFINRDEFGYWTIVISIGSCLTLSGSVSGFFWHRFFTEARNYKKD